MLKEEMMLRGCFGKGMYELVKIEASIVNKNPDEMFIEIQGERSYNKLIEDLELYDEYVLGIES